jgi:hypothetical protein
MGVRRLQTVSHMPWLAVWFRVWRLIVLRDGTGRVYVRWGRQRTYLVAGRRRASLRS